VAMPVVAVDLDDFSASGEHDVRAPGQSSALDPESVSHPVEHGADKQLGLGIPVADAGHVAGAL